jgi:hypothetical protein
MPLLFFIDSKYVLLPHFAGVCWSHKQFLLSQNNPQEWKTLTTNMHRNCYYNGVREVVTQFCLLRKLTYAQGSSLETVVVEVENGLALITNQVPIVRKMNNLRNILRNRLLEAQEKHEAAEVQNRNVIGHIPPFGTITLENFKNSALLSRYFLAQVVTYYTKGKVSSMVTYTTITPADITFLWIVLLSFTTDNGFNKKRYFDALPFIMAVCEAEKIVDWVHGSTDVLKPEVLTVSAPPRAARVAAAAASDSSSSSASSSDASSSEEDAPPVPKAPIVGRTGRA